jgi:hypothetical protein
MEVLDYGRAFLTFVTPGRGNNARLQVESRCRVSDGKKTWEYWFYASCKSEDTFARRDLFYEDNYDFCGVFSDEEYAIFRTRARHEGDFSETGLWRERFDDLVRHLPTVSAEVLSDVSSVVAASLQHRPLIGQVSYHDAGYEVHLEFPVKTMNVNDIEMMYQVDTGPLCIPDLSAKTRLMVERLQPAYVAYNAPDFADFIIQQPQKEGNIEVAHYGTRRSVAAHTRVLAL